MGKSTHATNIMGKSTVQDVPPYNAPSFVSMLRYFSVLADLAVGLYDLGFNVVAHIYVQRQV